VKLYLKPSANLEQDLPLVTLTTRADLPNKEAINRKEPKCRNPTRNRRLLTHLDDAEVRIQLVDSNYQDTNNALITDFDIFSYKQQLPFTNSKAKEINSLVERNVFEIILLSDILANVQLFTSRFVNKIKFSRTLDAIEKSRLVVRAYQDYSKEKILIQSLTIQQAS
jgi:hypothetical protein